jgi:hypothetical protein
MRGRLINFIIFLLGIIAFPFITFQAGKGFYISYTRQFHAYYSYGVQVFNTLAESEHFGGLESTTTLMTVIVLIALVILAIITFFLYIQAYGFLLYGFLSVFIGFNYYTEKYCFDYLKTSLHLGSKLLVVVFMVGVIRFCLSPSGQVYLAPFTGIDGPLALVIVTTMTLFLTISLLSVLERFDFTTNEYI